MNEERIDKIKMKIKKSVFEQIYENYLEQISEVSFESIAEKIEAEIINKNILKVWTLDKIAFPEPNQLKL